MKIADELMLVPRGEGFQAWRSSHGSDTRPESETRSRKNADWIALPARCLVSIPMHFQGVDGTRRESAAQLELEAAGFGGETAESHDFDLLPLGNDLRDQPTASFIQVAALPEDVLDEGLEARYAPSVAFQKLHPGELLIWKEDERLVMAVPHESGGPLHFQALASRLLNADAAAEIRCILASLDLAALLPDLSSICVALPEAEEGGLAAIPEEFRESLDLPVTARREVAPVIPALSSRLIPAQIVKERAERQQRRLIAMGALAFVFVLLAALGAFAARVALRDRALSQELARLDALESELAAIRDARENWDNMRTALNPEHYPVEALYQLVSLLPPEGIRMVRFEVREDGLVMDGEASSLGHGIEFRDKLVGAEAFNRWRWDFPQPTNLPDGRATFRAEAREPGEDDTFESES